MNIQDLETAVRLELPVVAMVWTDSQYGLIRWKQEAQFGQHSHIAFSNPDFVKLAEAFGAVGMRVERTEDLGGILLVALGSMGQRCTRAIEIVTSQPGNIFYSSQTVKVEAQGMLPGAERGLVRYVDFYREGAFVCRDFTTPFTCDWAITSADDGFHAWLAEASLESGHVVASEEATLVVAIGAEATGEPELIGFMPGIGTATYVAVDGAEAFVGSAEFGHLHGGPVVRDLDSRTAAQQLDLIDQ